jgi:predicted RNase H-like HicB family nuclease
MPAMTGGIVSDILRNRIDGSKTSTGKPWRQPITSEAGHPDRHLAIHRTPGQPETALPSHGDGLRCDINKNPDNDLGVSFPDFPGCITAGRTLDEAKAPALEALTGHIVVMREAGEPVPAPSTLDKAINDPQFRDDVAFLVHVEEPPSVSSG